MDNPLILAFDVGTQNVRAMLIDNHGNVEDIEKIAYDNPYYSKETGWAEQSCDYYWDNMCHASRVLRSRNEQAYASRLIGVTLTAIRDTIVCVDKKYEPLRDAILWLDNRQTEYDRDFPLFLRLIYKITGMYKTACVQRSSSACNWIMNHESELWKRTHKLMMLPGYLTCRLTGNPADSTANMIGHIPFDAHTFDWMKKGNIKRKVFDIPNPKLVDLVDPGSLLGGITGEASLDTGIPEGVPVYATGSDKGCETLGLSVTSMEKASLSFGTTATVQMTTRDYIEPQRLIPPFPAVIKGFLNPEVEINKGYWLVNWFLNEFAEDKIEEAKEKGVDPEDLLNSQLKDVPPGSGGIIFQPYFTPGLNNPLAKGAVIGLSENVTKAHLYRSIIEGINFALTEGLENIEKNANVKVTELYAAGGGSKSNEILQITADMFGRPVKRIQTSEAAGLGAAMIGFNAAGVFENIDEAVEKMVHVKDTFEPDEKAHEIYESIYSGVFVKILGKLLPLYQKEKELERQFKPGEGK
ncbi:MAG: FGGY-family carbohydrate kinase [Eubacteriales bacterium]|nr:FGGY-family carbohydrate kinase [Eubacteriales bacterium]